MKKLIPYLFALVLVSAGAAYYLNSSQTTGASAEELLAARENSEGLVTVSIVFLNPSGTENSGDLAFQVSLNTHSVNLDLFDLSKNTYLKTDKGNVIRAVKWEESGSSGGHHRSGILKFPADSDLERGGFDLVMYDLAGIDERVFSWQ